jgi:hypothetical protein
MDVLKLKKTGDTYFVQYEENQDVKTIKTEDEPESELVAAMDGVALGALRLFDIQETPCKLFSVEWKDGEKAGSKCVLLSGETSVYGPMKVFLPKVSTQEAETFEESYDPENLKNQYNQSVDRPPG